MPEEFEKYLQDICRQHDFSIINVSFNATQVPEYIFSAHVHWRKIADEIPCQSGMGATMVEAIEAAIRNANAERKEIKERAA